MLIKTVQKIIILEKNVLLTINKIVGFILQKFMAIKDINNKNNYNNEYTVKMFIVCEL